MRRILIVDAEKHENDALVAALPGDTYIVQHATDSESTLHRIRAWKPHVVFLSTAASAFKASELVPRIRLVSPDDYTAIVLLGAEGEADEVLKALDAGADDYMQRGSDPRSLMMRLRTVIRLKELQDSLRRANHRVEELTLSDELTGLLNMRALFRRGEEEIQRSRRFRKPISSLLINLDGFAGVNQSFGFLFGSFVLQEAANRLKKALRTIDYLARVGADEYFALLVETDLAGAEFVAERIRDALQGSEFRNEKGSCRLTCGIGVAGILPEQVEQKMSDLLHVSSEALRSAKATGPGSIEIYSFT